MNELTIMRRIAKLEPNQQAMVEAFIEFLEQKSQTGVVATPDDPSPLRAGFLKGTFTMKDDFDEPLDDFKEYME